MRRPMPEACARALIASLSPASEEGLLRDEADLWDSGFVESPENLSIRYEGKELRSGCRYYWKVQIRDGQGLISQWSPVGSWGMGLLEAADWQGAWIGLTDSLAEAWTPAGEVPGNGPMPLLRTEFVVDGRIKRAVAYVCGLGHFELRLNGGNVTDRVLEPGWTDYDQTCLYAAYEVTEQVRQGANAVGIMLGNGFYNVNGTRYTKFKGSYGLPKAILQLVVELEDGRTVGVSSGGDWQIAPGPIVFSCVYGGEDYDATKELEGWDQPGAALSDVWSPAPLVRAAERCAALLCIPSQQGDEELCDDGGDGAFAWRVRL